MKCVFGNVGNEKMKLSQIGEIAKKIWQEIPVHFKNVNLDEYIIMPNHIHGIINILFDARDSRGDACVANTAGGNKSGPKPNSLGAIVGSFKSAVTKRINEKYPGYNKCFWQRGYYDRIIRNENEYHKIQEYINNNPLYWDWDRMNPEKIKL